MSNQDYIENVYQHLSQYKVNKLKIVEDGIYRKNKKPYKHILPDKEKRLNIIEPIRDKFWNYFKTTKIKLHTDFHHLNSSQALCFNLFYPMINRKEKYLNFLKEIFECKNNEEDNFDIFFEWVDNFNLMRQEGIKSHHDVFIDFGKIKYLVEIKYTEHTDASCSSSIRNANCNNNIIDIINKNLCPLEKDYKTLYMSYLSNCYDIKKLGSKFKNDCPFNHGEQYQLMRYIELANLKSTSAEKWIPVIIYPEKNQFIGKEVEKCKEFLLQNIELLEITLEQFIDKLELYDPILSNWLKERYII